MRRPRKTEIEGVDVTCCGRLFPVRAAVTGKAQSLTVDSCVRWIVSYSEKAEWRCPGPRGQPCTGAHWQSTTVLSHANTGTQEQRA